MFLMQDWSVFRVTILLYALVVLFPVNIYVANSLLQNTQADSIILKHLKTIGSNTVELLETPARSPEHRLIRATDTLLAEVETGYMKADGFNVPSGTLNPQVVFHNLQGSWEHFKEGIGAEDSLRDLVTKSTAVQKETMKLMVVVDTLAGMKRSSMMNRLYMSLIATMIIMVATIYFVRVSMRLQLERHTIYDIETKLFNRDYFDAEVKKACALAIRKQHPIALIAVGIDHFNASILTLNDRQYEEVMGMVGGLFQAMTRTSDTTCRYEEDEFIIITPETRLQDAMTVAHRIHKRFLEHDFMVNHPVSVSISVALQHENEEVSTLVKRLTKTLREAKKAGNTVLTADVRQ